jgi:D,D-heptose 1,7-bisphosphate phosphatase
MINSVFLDRDGVINDLVYNKEEGYIGSPLSKEELHVFPFAPQAIKEIQNKGFKVIVISNQPGVAKKQFSLAEHMKINKKMDNVLSRKGCKLDGKYFCLHSPNALIKKYKKNCNCRKPKPGLILQAAKEHNIDLKNSYFVGDSLSDVKAGKAAGCKTILVGHVTDFLNRMIEQEKAEPDFMVPSLKEIPKLLEEQTVIETQ